MIALMLFVAWQLSPTQTGRMMCVFAVTAAAIRPPVTKSIARFSQRKAIAFAFAMLAVAMFLVARPVTTGRTAHKITSAGELPPVEGTDPCRTWTACRRLVIRRRLPDQVGIATLQQNHGRCVDLIGLAAQPGRSQGRPDNNASFAAHEIPGPACPLHGLPTPLSRSPENTAGRSALTECRWRRPKLCLIITRSIRIITTSRVDIRRCAGSRTARPFQASVEASMNCETSSAPVQVVINMFLPTTAACILSRSLTVVSILKAA